ncbi:MAG: FHA domain-containing protein [Actinomycetota bacterium]|nr:FHA domain-containing protein [Actinomycetota bacterium]
MPEPLLAILKLCALALLYLFFLRVLRAVWAEVGSPRVAVAAAGRPQERERRPLARRERASSHLTIVEPPQHRGRSFGLADELTVGRAAGCQVTLDDDYASQLHARIFRRDGTLYVEDLGSTNGTYLNTRKVSAPMALKRGDRLKIGGTVMELTG